MKATITNVRNEYKYTIEGIQTINYVGKNLVLVFVENGEIKTTQYNSIDVIVTIC